MPGWPEDWFGQYWHPVAELDVPTNQIAYPENVKLVDGEVTWETLVCDATVAVEVVSTSTRLNEIELTIHAVFGNADTYRVVLRPPEDGDCSKLEMEAHFDDGTIYPPRTLLRGRQYVVDTCDDGDDLWTVTLDPDVPRTCEQ